MTAVWSVNTAYHNPRIRPTGVPATGAAVMNSEPDCGFGTIVILPELSRNDVITSVRKCGPQKHGIVGAGTGTG